MPGMVRQLVLGRRPAPAPNIRVPGETSRMRRSRASRNRPSSANPSRPLPASRAAAPSPAMPEKFSVPIRRPRSCPPPNTIGLSGTESATTRAPTPAGPPILWADSDTMSTPSAVLSTGILPAACTASQCTRAPKRRATSAIPATGCTTPVSLLASMTETRAGVPSPASRESRASRSTTPSGSTGINAAPAPAMSTDSCSTVETRMRSRPEPLRARLLASVPPLVNTTSAGAAPTRAATASRASSTARRTARPKPCTDEALPVSDRAAATASAAAGLTVVVAL